MANVGDRCQVGNAAPETGRYGHSACQNTLFFNKGTILAPCPNPGCPGPGAEWVLHQKLT
jgi:hypothetical protein